MCGLFGFLYYGKGKLQDANKLTNSLARESAIRGTDASGISYNSIGGLTIFKASKSAYALTLKHPANVKAVMGHTRHTTQGNEKVNRNNHPFMGKTKQGKFALAHNGVLYNDRSLRNKYHLPHTKIETDSYIAVQLIESKDKLNMDSLKFMAENVGGSFSFSLLDDANNLYLVKGDSPIALLHFPKLKLYVYASTPEILWKALILTPVFDSLKRNEHEEIMLTDGDLLEVWC